MRPFYSPEWPFVCVGAVESILLIFIAINSISCPDLNSMARVFPPSQRDQRHEMWNIFPKRPNIFESRRKFAQNSFKWRQWPQKPGGVNREGRKRRGVRHRDWPHSRYWVILLAIKLLWLCQVAKRLRVFEYNLILIHFILTIPEIQF